MRSLLRDWRWVLAHISDASPGLVRGLWLWVCIDAAMLILLPFVAKELVDAVLAPQPSTTVVMAWLGAELLTVIVGGIAQRATDRSVQILRTNGGVIMTALVLEKLQRVAYAEFEDSDFLNKVSRAREDATVHAADLAFEGFAFARSALVIVGCLALLASVSVWAIPVLLIAPIPSFLAQLSLARQVYRIERKHEDRNRKGWYLEWVLTSALNAKEIKSLQAGSWLLSMYRSLHHEYCDERADALHRGHRIGVIALALSSVALYVPYGLVVLGTVRGDLTVGQMILFLVAFRQGSQALLDALSSMGRASEKQLYVRNVTEIVTWEEADDEHAFNSEDILRDAPDVVFDGISFTYPGGIEPVINDMSFSIRAGETLALVGHNGAGKTTLVKLLLGLYPLSSGKIMVGEHDLAERSLGWRRQNIGVMFQDFVRFHFDVQSNVDIGWVPDIGNSDETRRVLKLAGADAIVADLERDIETPLGASFGGRELSGGQWQKIGLARLIRRQSRVWILDEPTSAMDPEAEEQTFRQFAELTHNRTAIIIAHRFSTVRMADRIAVMEHGRVIEHGTHEQLLAADGLYARLFNMQARTFRDDNSTEDDGAT